MTTSHLLGQSAGDPINNLMVEKRVSCGRWVAGGVGATVAVGAVVFIILGCVRTDWFVRSIGTVGDPKSWALWTISGGGLIISGTLMAYAILSKDGKATKNHLGSNQSTTVSDHTTNHSSSSKKLLRHAQSLQELLEDNKFVGLISLHLRCVSNDDKIKEHIQMLNATFEQEAGLKADSEKFDEQVNKAKETKCLTFNRRGDEWIQDCPGYVKPSFIRHADDGRLVADKANPFVQNEEWWGQQEIGLACLKALMKRTSRTVVDHNGLEWRLG